MRTIILHYHLFKNAGTSVDQILQANFGRRWISREFPMTGDSNTPALEGWIRENPEAAAFSTHTAYGPLPRIDGVRVISLLLLRDPIARIRSAYRFERAQQADTFGARLAKETDFEGYVRARLNRPGDRQCRNFQTYRLAGFAPGPAPELERAQQAAQCITVLGRVEAFDAAMTRLVVATQTDFPDLACHNVTANRSTSRLSDSVLKPELQALLQQANNEDLRFLNHIFAA